MAHRRTGNVIKNVRSRIAVAAVMNPVCTATIHDVRREGYGDLNEVRTADDLVDVVIRRDDIRLPYPLP